MQPQPDSNCIFCKIIAGDIPSARVHEDDTAIVFLDINQNARGHLLITPRAHAEQWHDLDPETASHLTRLSQQWAAPLVKSMEADGYNLLLNNGASAGQEIPHLHLHLIPRWNRDGLFRGMAAPRTADAAELQSTAQLIQDTLATREG